MTCTFIVGVQITGLELPTEHEVEVILNQGSIKTAFAELGRSVHLTLLTWPEAEWTVEEILQRDG
jgi:hypothetical protein